MKIRHLSAILGFALAIALGGFTATAQTSTNIASLTDLQGRLNERVDAPRFAQAEWGIKVVSLAGGKTVYEHNGDKLLKPASNAKMYTTSMALQRLGPAFRIKTSFYASAKPDADGIIHGDLLVYGRGDPSFSSRFNGGDYSKSLDPVVDAFVAAGIKKVDGDLVGDDSYFRGPQFGSDWSWDDLETYYGAPASALMVDDNCQDLVFKPGAAVGDPCKIVTMPNSDILTFSNRTHTIAGKSGGGIDIHRPIGQSTVYVWGQVPGGSKGIVDSVSLPDPALWFVSLLKTKLAQHGIAVTGGLRSIGWLQRDVEPLDMSKEVEVASVESRPLSEIIKNTLKPSQNQYAQLLLLQVGIHSDEAAEGNRNTESLGLREMRKFLSEAGVPRGFTLLHDGSGLSRASLVTASASVQLLTYMSRQKDFATFYDDLPIAGVDGTLRNRFKNTFGKGNIHAKTGSLAYVDTLSGYLTTRGGDKLVFSMMLNNYHGNGRHADGRAEIDALVNMLLDFTGKLP